VRQTEDLVRRLKTEKKKPKVSGSRSENLLLANLAEDLSRHFGTKVQIKKHGNKGKIEIEFYNNDDFDRLLQRLKQTTY
jgi:ParB family chromosome partitioning protein